MGINYYIRHILVIDYRAPRNLQRFFSNLSAALKLFSLQIELTYSGI